MNICFFNSHREWGGGEKWHYEAAEALAGKNYKVTVAADSDGPLFRKVGDDWASRVPVKVGNLSALNLVKLVKLIRLFRKLQLDAIILNLPSDLKLAGLAARLAGVHKIIYRRGSAIPIKNTLLNRLIFNRIVTHIIANSQETCKTILQNNSSLFPSNRIHVIYNSIDMPGDNAKLRGARDAGAPLIIGTAGRLSREKNQRALIDLAVYLKSRELDFRVKIAGAGEEQQALIEYAEERGVSEDVDFLGFVEDIDKFMISLDIFLLTSMWEGFGYVLIEAMRLGTPVIAFAVSCIPEIVLDGESGYLVPFDDVEAMGDKICFLAQNEDKRVTLGRRAIEDVRHRFSKSRSMQSLQKLLSEG